MNDTPQRPSTTDAPVAPRPKGPGGSPLSADVAHFTSTCALHGETMFARHRTGLNRAGEQRYTERCLACHSDYNGEKKNFASLTPSFEKPASRPSPPSGGSPRPVRARTGTQPPVPAGPVDQDPHGGPDAGDGGPGDGGGESLVGTYAAQILDGTLTHVHARPITHAEITAVATGAGPQAFDGFLSDGQTLTPTLFTVRTRRSARDHGKADAVTHRVYYAAQKHLDRFGADRGYVADKDQPVGYGLTLDTRTMFGREGSQSVFTSAEAEQSARQVHGQSDPARGRTRIHLSDARAPLMPLVALHGSEISVSALVAGLDPETVALRAEAALRREFGDALGARLRIRSRPAEDRRVMVTSVGRTPADDKVIAVGVLDSEVEFVKESTGCREVRVEPVPDEMIYG